MRREDSDADFATGYRGVGNHRSLSVTAWTLRTSRRPHRAGARQGIGHLPKVRWSAGVLLQSPGSRSHDANRQGGGRALHGCHQERVVASRGVVCVLPAAFGPWLALPFSSARIIMVVWAKPSPAPNAASGWPSGMTWLVSRASVVIAVRRWLFRHCCRKKQRCRPNHSPALTGWSKMSCSRSMCRQLNQQRQLNRHYSRSNAKYRSQFSASSSSSHPAISLWPLALIWPLVCSSQSSSGFRYRHGSTFRRNRCVTPPR